MNKPFKLVDKGNVKAEFTNISFKQSKRIHGIDSYFHCLTAKDRGTDNILVSAYLTDFGYKQTSKILNKEGIAATLDTMQGGHREPKILETVKSEYKFNQESMVYETKEMDPALTTSTQDICYITYKGEDIELPCICASRGRNPINPSSRIVGLPTEQFLEINKNKTSNTITTVQKDNYAIEKNYRVRKLTPLECWRLMSFSDEDFYKAKNAGISNSQLYKQAGNSIVVKVLEGIFKNLLIDNEQVKEITTEEEKRKDRNIQLKWCI